MTLPSYVKPKGKIWGKLPIVGNSTVQSIAKFIFFPDSVYNNLLSSNPNPKYIALLIHEQIHRKRQIEIGTLKFILKYIFDSDFRLFEELLAIGESMKYLKSIGHDFDFDTQAKHLSSYLYFWSIDHISAKSKLHDMWDLIMT